MRVLLPVFLAALFGCAPARQTTLPAWRVRVLSTPGCAQCRAVETYLAQQHIPFQELDVDVEPGKTMYRSFGEGGVPVVLIDDIVIRSFNKRALADALRTRNITAATSVRTSDVK